MGFNEKRGGNDKVLKSRNLSCRIYDAPGNRVQILKGKSFRDHQFDGERRSFVGSFQKI